MMPLLSALLFLLSIPEAVPSTHARLITVADITATTFLPGLSRLSPALFPALHRRLPSSARLYETTESKLDKEIDSWVKTDRMRRVGKRIAVNIVQGPSPTYL